MHDRIHALNRKRCYLLLAQAEPLKMNGKENCMAQIELPNTGLKVNLRRDVVYHGVELVDDVVEAARRLEDAYQIPPDKRYPIEYLSMPGYISKVQALCSEFGSAVDSKRHVHLILPRVIRDPCKRTFLLGHEEFHAASIMDDRGASYPFEQIREKISQCPFTNWVSKWVLRDQIVSSRFITNDLGTFMEILADMAGVMAVERQHGYSVKAEKVCFEMLSVSPQTYGLGLAELLGQMRDMPMPLYPITK